MKKLNNGKAMSRVNNLNTIKMIGTIVGNAEFSHSVVRKDESGNVSIPFCSFTLEVPRLSGVSDFLEVVIPEKTWLETFNHKELAHDENIPKTVVEIFGRIQSRNCLDTVTGKNKLDLFVSAKSIRCLTERGESESINTLTIEGFLCKTPVIRQTPLGRTIADLFIAVNRPGGSSYIPVVLWGGNAVNAKDLKIGDKLRLDGRFQSREYTKDVNGTISTHMAYEMSASKVKLLNGADAQF